MFEKPNAEGSSICYYTKNRSEICICEKCIDYKFKSYLELRLQKIERDIAELKDKNENDITTDNTM